MCLAGSAEFERPFCGGQTHANCVAQLSGNSSRVTLIVSFWGSRTQV